MIETMKVKARVSVAQRPDGSWSKSAAVSGGIWQGIVVDGCGHGHTSRKDAEACDWSEPRPHAIALDDGGIHLIVVTGTRWEVAA